MLLSKPVGICCRTILRQCLILLNILINCKSRMLMLQKTSVDRLPVIRLCIRLKPWIFPSGLEQTRGQVLHSSWDKTPSFAHWAAGLGMKSWGHKYLHCFPGVLARRLAVKEGGGQRSSMVWEKTSLHDQTAHSTPTVGKQQRYLQGTLAGKTGSA